VSLPVAVLALVVGLVLLVRSADTFVEGAEAVALRLGWSRAVIGAVVVGFGTSLPELVTSVLAAFGGQPDLALGNAAGSNVANLLLILGVAALVAPIVGAPHQAPRRDAVIAGRRASRCCSSPWTAASARSRARSSWVCWSPPCCGRSGAAPRARRSPARRPAARSSEDLPLPVPDRFVGLRVVGGLVGVLVGAQLLVAGATDLAEQAGLPQIVIGSVLVAVGTSLPELATAIASARRGQVELLLGNLLGSNAFNALMVVGVSAVVAGARGDGFPVDGAALGVVVAAAVVTVVAALLLARRPTVSRPVGAVLVALHVASVPVLLLTADGATVDAGPRGAGG
jgi:cation:H+ antiporter